MGPDTGKQAGLTGLRPLIAEGLQGTSAFAREETAWRGSAEETRLLQMDRTVDSLRLSKISLTVSL